MQVVPAVGQSLGAVHAAFARSHRQTARQVCSQIKPGAHSLVDAHATPSALVRVGSHAQATWSIPAGSTQASPAGHPVVPALAAAAVGSQLALQV